MAFVVNNKPRPHAGRFFADSELKTDWTFTPHRAGKNQKSAKTKKPSNRPTDCPQPSPLGQAAKSNVTNKQPQKKKVPSLRIEANKAPPKKNQPNQRDSKFVVNITIMSDSEDDSPPKVVAEKPIEKQVVCQRIQAGTSFSEFRDMASQFPSANNSPVKRLPDSGYNLEKMMHLQAPVVVRINDVELETPSSSSVSSNSPIDKEKSPSPPIKLQQQTQVMNAKPVCAISPSQHKKESSSPPIMFKMSPNAQTTPVAVNRTKPKTPSPPAVIQAAPVSVYRPKYVSPSTPAVVKAAPVTVVPSPPPPPPPPPYVDRNIFVKPKEPINERIKQRLEQLRSKCSQIETSLQSRADEIGTSRRRISSNFSSSSVSESDASVTRQPASPSLTMVSDQSSLTAVEITPSTSASNDTFCMASPENSKDSGLLKPVDHLEGTLSPTTLESLSIEIPRSRTNSMENPPPEASPGPMASSGSSQLLIPASEVQNLPGIAAVRQRERNNFYMDVYGSAPPPVQTAPQILKANKTLFENVRRHSVQNNGPPLRVVKHPSDLVEEVRQRRRSELLNVDRMGIQKRDHLNSRINQQNINIPVSRRANLLSNMRQSRTKPEPTILPQQALPRNTFTSNFETTINVPETKEISGVNLPVGTLVSHLDKSPGRSIHPSKNLLNSKLKVVNNDDDCGLKSGGDEDDDGYFSRRNEVTSSGPYFSKLYFSTGQQ